MCVALLAALAGAVMSLGSALPASAAYSEAGRTALGLSRLGAGVPVSRVSASRRAQQSKLSPEPSGTKPYRACPQGPCEAIVDPRAVRASGRWALPAGGQQLEGAGELGGYDPQDLQSAYQIPTAGGSTQTIALVDAYGYKAAEEDLGKYRQRYGLEPCTKANGCFRKVNQQGEEAKYPSAEKGWEGETALDLDMASAACPSCHILLVEADSASVADLAAAADTAARLGATEISNSYGLAESRCAEADCQLYSAAYDHPGVLITASAGDKGYDDAEEGNESPSYPASLPYVVAVGGTSLNKASNSRGWSEQVWSEPERRVGTGSGCSASEPKPIWQADTGCAMRTDDDVAAVAACETPVSVYSAPYHGWVDLCGTSVSSPLVAGIEAHASEYALSLPGADAFYADPGALFDVTSGSNEGREGECAAGENEYLCHAEVGYDGPTGNGTPHGPLDIDSAPPLVATRPADDVSSETGILSGEADAQGADSAYRFEYGTTTAYGVSAPVPDGSAGSGTTEQEVRQEIGGLQPQTTYHYRLVARNGAGTSAGEDRTFRTAPPTVTGVAPGTGPTDGGTSVTISGENFAGATAVQFGQTDAKSFKVESESSITVVSPAGSGDLDVTVVTPAGTSTTTSEDRFSYQLGPVLAWGHNWYGALGDGTTESHDVPVEVHGLSDADAIATGFTWNTALLQDGTVAAWGFGEDGQLGNGGSKSRHIPVPVSDLGEVASVEAGWNLGLALLADGTVMAWGDSVSVPTPVCTVGRNWFEACAPEHELKDVVAVAGGGQQSLALLRDGTVVAWGGNESGELGDGTFTNSDVPVHVCTVAESPCSPANYLGEVAAISGGGYHSVALLRNGTVMSWGHDYTGALGAGSTAVENSDVPLPACTVEESQCSPEHELRGVTAISAGFEHTLALLGDGQVLAWGDNRPDAAEGDLGDATTASSDIPVKVCATGATACPDGPYLQGVTAVSAGTGNSLALLEDGEVRSWGENAWGDLGDGKQQTEQEYSDVPVTVCAADLAGCDGGALTGITTLATDGQRSLAAGLPPTVSSVRPDAGPLADETAVTITGTSLSGATAVHFGTAEATNVQVVSAGELTAIAPPGAGTVDVTVTTDKGVSPASVADAFTYYSVPTAIGATATAITQNTAKLSATVDPDGAVVGECRFEYGTTSAYGSSAPCAPPPGSATGPVEVSASVAGLTPNSAYHFRLLVTNAAGIGTSPDESFTTLPALPSVATDAASSVTRSSASLNGTVDPDGAEVSECTFEYGATSAYGSSAPCASPPGSGEGAVAVSATVEGLSESATYHFRIIARNRAGVSYGSDEAFGTQPYELPGAVTGAALPVSPMSATLNATVDSNGDPVSDCHFEYGTTDSYGSQVPCSPDGEWGLGPLTVSAVAAGLTEDTTYHFRIVATNSAGTSYGTDLMFRTGPPDFGRCIEVSEGTGSYGDSACTRPGGHARYEWEPGVTRAAFTTALRTGPVTLATAAKASTVTCSGESGTGGYTGVKSVGGLVITLTGCERAGEQCSSGLVAGEVVSNMLEGVLGVARLGSSARKDKIGLDLFSLGGAEALLEFSCGMSTVSVRGSVIVTLKADHMSPSQALTFAAAGTRQKPESFVGEARDVLEESLDGGPFEQAGLKLAITQTGEEPVEVDATA